MSKHKEYRALGKPGRRLVCRLAPGTDLMGGIARACEEADVRAGGILVVIGGVSSATVEVATLAADSPVGVRAKSIELAGPLAILGAQGMVCETAGGRLEPHVHITLVDANGRVAGGHLVEGTAPVTTTADVIIEEVLGVEFGRREDPDVGAVLFFPAEKNEKK
jgi:predicted DNA-binding protein with PD1-like motif